MLVGRDLSDRKLQIDCLDGLRGLAVLIVFLSHTSNGGVLLVPGGNFSGTGKSGVYLFFVLSAFLLTYPFLRKGADAARRTFLLSYAVRRFFRIYPLYSLYLVVAFLTSLPAWRSIAGSHFAGVPFELSGVGLVRHLVLLDGKGVTWSIPVEFSYYFVLPFIALAYALLLRNRVIPAIALTAVLTLLCEYVWPQAESLPNDTRLGPYLPIFLIGSCLAVVHHNWVERRLGSRRAVVISLELLGLMAAAGIILTIPSVTSFVFGRDFPPNYFHKQFILFAVLWGIVLFASVNGAGMMRMVFESPPLRYLGFISFSAYLLHPIVIDGVREAGWFTWYSGWLMLGITVAVSHVSWILIERPSSRVRYPSRRAGSLVAT